MAVRSWAVNPVSTSARRLAGLAVALLVSLPAHAQTQPSTREPRWNVDLDTVVGRWSVMDATVVSSLAAVRYRALRQLSVGAVVPFAFGSGSSFSSSNAMLGGVAVFGYWEARPTGATRLPIGLLVALPTALVPQHVVPSIIDGGTRAAEVVEITRVYADREFFNERLVALVPSVGVSHELGRVTLSASAKLGLLWEPTYWGAYFFVDTVATAQAMVTLVDRPGATLSGGLRSSAAYAIMGGRCPVGPGPDPPPLCDELHVGLEPRLEARLGAFSLRGGLIMPVVPFDWESRHFPAAWGVRLGGSYTF